MGHISPAKMGKEKLNTKFNIQDPLHIADWNPFTSVFGYKDYHKVSNWVVEYQDLAPDSNNLGWGGNVTFHIPKRSTLLGPVQLKAVLSAVTPVGGGTARLVDYAGFRMYEHINARYGSNPLQRLDWRIMWVLHKLYKSRSKRDAENALVGGNLSVSERQALALSTQSFITDLPFFWTHHPSLFLTLDALSHPLEIIVTLSDMAAVGQGTSGTAPTITVNDIKLKCRMLHVEDEERDYLIDRCLEGAGVVKAIRDFETQYNNIIAGGSTSFDIGLTNLRGVVTEFRYFVQNYIDNNSAGTVNNNPFNTIKVASWEIKAAGLQVVDPMTDTENRHLFNAQEHSGDTGVYIYGESNAIDVEDWLNSTGHDNYGGFTQPKITVNFASDPGQCVMHVIAVTANTTQESKGDVIKNFI